MCSFEENSGFHVAGHLVQLAENVVGLGSGFVHLVCAQNRSGRGKNVSSQNLIEIVECGYEFSPAVVD